MVSPGEAKDEFRSLVLKLTGEIDDYLDALKKAEDETEKTVDQIQTDLEAISLGSKMMALGGKLTLGVTAPIKAMEAVALKAWSTQERSELVLEGMISANERRNSALMDQYKEFASGLQEITTTGDETSLALIGVAETLGVTGSDAKRAVKEAIALSSALGISEQAAVRYTSALAQGNTTMLHQYIPGLREMETESERVAAAHDHLEKMFTVAEASAQTFGGQLTQLKNDLGDLFEMFGKILSEIAKPFIQWIRDLVKWFQSWPESVKVAIVVLAELAAAVGPVLTVLGALILLASGIRMAMDAIVAHPVIAGVVALTAVISVLVSEMQQYNAVLREGIELPGKMLGSTERMVKSHQAQLRTLWELNQKERVRNKDLDEAKKTIRVLEGLYGDLGLSVNEVTGKIDGLGGALKTVGERHANMVKRNLQNTIDSLVEEQNRLHKDMSSGFWERFGAGFKEGKTPIESLAGGMGRAFTTYKGLADRQKEVDEELAESRRKFNEINQEGLAGGAGDWLEENQKKSEEMAKALGDTLDKQILALQNKGKTQEEIIFEQLKENQLSTETADIIQDQIDKVRELLEEEKRLKREEKERLDNLKKIVDKQSDYRKRSEQIINQYKTPFQEAMQTLNELKMYKGMGLIDLGTYQRGVRAAMQSYRDAMGVKEGERPTFGAVQTIARGSVAEQVLMTEHRMAMAGVGGSQSDSDNLKNISDNTRDMKQQWADLIQAIKEGGWTVAGLTT